MSAVNPLLAISPPTPAEWNEGRQRAIAMLKEIAALGADETTGGSEWRDGRPQQNAAYPHLLGLSGADKLGVLVAFASVLTHYLGNQPIETYDDDVELQAPVRMCWPAGSLAKFNFSPQETESASVT